MASTQPLRPGPSEGEGVAALFDCESGGYDAAHEGALGHVLRARLATVLELLGPGPGNVLDAGMGPGRLCEQLGDRGWTASGVDISERMVALAAARLPDAGERLVQGSVVDLPFEDASFDAVAATGVLEYLEDPAAGVGELARVLRPGGLAVVSIPNPRSLSPLWNRHLWYPAVRLAKRALPALPRPSPFSKPPSISLQTLEAMAVAAGFDPVDVRHTGVAVLPTPFDHAAPRLAERLARRLESSPRRATRGLATQIVVAARKARTPPHSGESFG